MRNLLVTCLSLGLASGGCAGLIGLDDKTDVSAAAGAAGATSQGGASAQGGNGGSGTTGGHGGTLGPHGGSAGAATGGMAGGAGKSAGTSGHGGTAGHSGAGGTSAGASGQGGSVAGHGGSTGGAAGSTGGASGSTGGLGGSAGDVGGDGGVGGVGGSAGGAGGDAGGIGGNSGGTGGVGGDSGGASGSNGGGGASPVTTLVFSYYIADSNLPEDQRNDIYRFNPDTDGLPENLSNLLDPQLGIGNDFSVNVSHDGKWLVFVTDRGDCTNSACIGVALNDATLSGAKLIKHKTQFSTEYVLNRDYTRPAINNSATQIAYSTLDPVDSSLQIWVVSRPMDSGVFPDQWQLTTIAGSGHSNNVNPSFTPDEKFLYFECTAPAATLATDVTGRDICTSAVPMGSPTTVALKAADLDGTMPMNNGVGHPSLSVDGDLMFTAQRDGEFALVWHKKPSGEIEILSDTNTVIETSPCAFSDGRAAFMGRQIQSFPENFGSRIAASKDPDAFKIAASYPMFPMGDMETIWMPDFMGCGVSQ